MQPARDIPQVLASMVQIDDLGRTREMQVGVIPDPFGAVAHDDFLCRTVPAAIVCFPVEAFAKRCPRSGPRRQDGGTARPHPGSQARLPFGPRCLGVLNGGLGEDATVSFLTTGIPVPSIWIYRIGIGFPAIIGRSNCTAR